jgi:hypothetical protein
MFRVEYSLHIQHSGKWLTFVREERLPFVPFIGLDVLDDAIGEFKLTSVAWHSPSQSFLCQAQKTWERRSIRQFTAWLTKAGWTWDKSGDETAAD